MRGPHVRLGVTAPSLHHIKTYSSIMIMVTITCLIHVSFDRITKNGPPHQKKIHA